MPAMLQPRLDQKHVRLDLSRFEGDVQLNIDAQLVEQALHGLVVNAVEAAPEGGSVRVTLACDGERAAITIEDDGAGMPFAPEPTGLRPGPSTKRFGTGLGIPFAVKVFDRHGGSVRFVRAEQGGTCVHINLPA
jgi:signal transduction histidine kinase